MKTVSEKLQQSQTQPKVKYTSLKILAVILVIIIALFILGHPLKSLSKKFVKQGDSLLLQKKYVSADLQYEKALKLNPNDQTAKDHQEIAQKAQKDISALLPFFKDSNSSAELARFDQANAFPENENSALNNAKKLIENGDYQLAIIPAETATQMSPDYKTAWQYLQIANLKASQLAELSPESQRYYVDRANQIKSQKLAEAN